MSRKKVYMFLGRTCTLKIYNKLLEFLKHDKRKLVKLNMEKYDCENEYNLNFFDVIEYENKIQGYLRFELEIKKRMLMDFYGRKDIRILDVNYEELVEVWKMEFLKLYSMKKENAISDRLEVKFRLEDVYGKTAGNTFYDFYLRILTEGESYVKNCSTKSSFYRKRKKLQDAGIDFSKRCEIKEIENSLVLRFNPFLDLEMEVS